MDLLNFIFFALGILSGNIISHRFILKRDWEDTLIISMLITIIALGIALLINFYVLDYSIF